MSGNCDRNSDHKVSLEKSNQPRTPEIYLSNRIRHQVLLACRHLLDRFLEACFIVVLIQFRVKIRMHPPNLHDLQVILHRKHPTTIQPRQRADILFPFLQNNREWPEHDALLLVRLRWRHTSRVQHGQVLASGSVLGHGFRPSVDDGKAQRVVQLLAKYHEPP